MQRSQHGFSLINYESQFALFNNIPCVGSIRTAILYSKFENAEEVMLPTD